MRTGVSLGTEGVWRLGSRVVTAVNHDLPDRCFKCNAPTQKKLKRKLYWHHPAWYFMILAGLLIYVIVAICVRKTSVTHVGLCPHHAKRRWILIATTWGGVLASVFLFFASANFENPGPCVITGVVLLLASIVTGILARPIAPVKIDQEHVHLKGAGSEFLTSLPEFRG